MSDACRELISLDKATREMVGKTFYPFTVMCDNSAACKNTQMEGSHKLCDFDGSVEEVQENLKFRESTVTKRKISNVHGDYIKSLVLDVKVTIRWIPTKSNLADIFTKPLEYNQHRKFTCKILKI